MKMIIQKVIETVPDFTEGKEHYREWASYLKRIADSDGKLYEPFTEGKPIAKEDFDKIETYGPCKVEIIGLYWDLVAGGFMDWRQKKFSVNNGKEALKELEDVINGEMRILFQGKTTIKDTPFIVTYGREMDRTTYTELETRGGKPLGVTGHYSIFIRPNSNI
ncbi:MAG: hypothetical protein DRP13_01785 [Candidatus Aenigmatarchaeota archaeon]|nr:MAG: hypothetical protein DRP13_01785 [Candidatus Aenigmarchaeota archaeon]